jgi:8-oxo-dGTP pyrophosphatase MutT (NUDIX family)
MKQAAVMLIIKDGLILGVSRKDQLDKFGLIGGKCESNETPLDAAKRETFEEVGITVSACQPIYHRVEPKSTEDGEDFVAYCYYASVWQGEPISKEGTAVSWLTEEELTKTKAAFPDYNINTLTAFKRMHPYVLPGHIIPEGACGRCHEVHTGACYDNYPAGRMHRDTEIKETDIK